MNVPSGAFIHPGGLGFAGTFAVGTAMPVLTVLFSPRAVLIPVVVFTSILLLVLLGAFGLTLAARPC